MRITSEFRKDTEPFIGLTMTSTSFERPNSLGGAYSSDPSVMLTTRGLHYTDDGAIPQFLEVVRTFTLTDARDLRAKLDEHIANLEAGWTREKVEELIATLIADGRLEAVESGHRWIDGETRGAIHTDPLDIAIRWVALEQKAANS